MAEEVHETNEGILYFDAKKCIHSRNCVLARPDVFVPDVKGEWIHPERASSCELHMLEQNCPSGAIRFVENNKEQKPVLVNTLHIRENGPYALKAEIHLAGEEKPVTRMTLCRCGASKNKPYCDGSHVEIGFAASGEVATRQSDPLASRDGPLKVNPLKDGPLQLKGNLEICSGTGKTIDRRQKVNLCRCGHSKNKPFCDGTHKAVGFSAES